MAGFSAQNPLTRHTGQALIAGVCAGLARWLGWDVTAVRVAYVLLSLFLAGFPGLIAYVVLWLVMPAEE